MHCNGKCHLKKEFDKQEKQSAPFQNIKDKSSFEWFSQSNVFSLNSFSSSEILFSQYLFSVPALAHSAVFHPPSA